MEYMIGAALALAVAVGGAAVGFDRERSFYSLALIVIGSYYVLFAAMDPSGRAIGVEIAGAGVFALAAVVGFKKNLWLVAGATAGHGVFDYVHRFFIDNPGVPDFWPGFCGTFDVVFGAALAALLVSGRARA